MEDIDRFKSDIEELIDTGIKLYVSIVARLSPEEKEKVLDMYDLDEEDLLEFNIEYQKWYSDSLFLIRTILPSRYDDFIDFYKYKSNRSKITSSNYVLSDYLKGVVVPSSKWSSIVIPLFVQQYSIVSGLPRVLESSLYNIKNIVHADLLDSELHAAEELSKKGFYRASGAVAGVVLEGHLKSVCERREVTTKKKNPSISDYNDALKSGDIIDIPVWRNIQYLGDIRNTCDHKKTEEPTKDDIQGLISGVSKITKTVF